MKQDTKFQIWIGILCVLVAGACAKTINDIRTENAEYKNEWSPEQEVEVRE